MRKMQRSYCSRAGGTKEKVFESMNENCFQSVQRKSRTCVRITWHHVMLARYRWDWSHWCTEGWHHPGTHGRQHVEFWRASECASSIIQQLASQNHRKLKFQTATFPVVAKWAFLPWEEMRLNHTELMLDVSDSLSYSYVFISFARNSSDINRQKSTNIIKYTYIYTHNNSHLSIHQRGFGCKSVARGHRLFDWRSFGCLGRKDQTLPWCQKCQGSCL